MESTRERPILFSAPMVRALLAGTKAQTRRALKPQAQHRWNLLHVRDDDGAAVFCTGDHPSGHGCAGDVAIPSRYGVPGDRLWVRESLYRTDFRDESGGSCNDAIAYSADDALAWDVTRPAEWRWRRNTLPSIHCPRGLSRITLEVTEVRVQRLQDITDEDALAEGVRPDAFTMRTAGGAYADLWNQINGDGSWESNPWVWAISFRKLPR